MSATTGDAINHAIDKASDGLAQIAHAISSTAPQAWAVAVHGVYAQGLASIIAGGILFFAGLVGLPCFVYMGLKMRLAQDSEFLGICLFGGGVIFFVFFVIGTILFGNPNHWAMLISPDGYLAKQMLEGVTGQQS